MQYSELDITFDRLKHRLWIISDQEWVSEGDDKNRNENRRMIELEIELPRNPEIALSADLKAGEADIQLGGLGISGLDIDNMAGEIDVDFNRPNRIEMKRF